MRNGNELRGFKTHHRPTAATVNTAEIVVLGSSDGTLKVWNLTAEREVQTIAGRFGAISSIDWSDDQKRVVSASEDRSITVWDVASWRPVAASTCDWPVSCAAFADDKTIVEGDTVGYLHFLTLEDPKPNS